MTITGYALKFPSAASFVGRSLRWSVHFKSVNLILVQKAILSILLKLHPNFHTLISYADIGALPQRVDRDIAAAHLHQHPIFYIVIGALPQSLNTRGRANDDGSFV